MDEFPCTCGYVVDVCTCMISIDDDLFLVSEESVEYLRLVSFLFQV